MIVIPKVDTAIADIGARENLHLITYCENGRTIVFDPLVSKDNFIFKKDIPYIVNVIDQEIIDKLISLNNDEFVTELNNIKQPGYYIIRLSKNVKLNRRCFPQFIFKDIVEFETKNRYCSETMPWDNTLFEIEANKLYLIHIRSVLGLRVTAGVKESGVVLINDLDEAIQGVILNHNEYINNLSFETSDTEAKLRLYAISGTYQNPLDILKATVTIGEFKYSISFGMEYLGKVFTIKTHSKVYKGTLKVGDIEVVEVDIEPASIIFQPKQINELYSEISMFCYCADRLFHIRLNKNYIAETFYIVYKDTTFISEFSSITTIDTPAILRKANV